MQQGSHSHRDHAGDADSPVDAPLARATTPPAAADAGNDDGGDDDAPAARAFDPRRRWALGGVGVVLCLFTLSEVNFARLTPQTQVALFAMLGLVLSFLHYPMRAAWRENRWARLGDWLLAGLTVLVCGYIIVQNEPAFRDWWLGGNSLSNRAGREAGLDLAVGALLVLLLLEGTRRCIGWALPILAMIFFLYALYGAHLPSWLMPHRGYDFGRTVSHTVLQSQGVFGVALRVMFTYVFLFVVFGAFLKATGATRFIIDFARRMFRNSLGGAAKVSVLSSGLMGSLSGSAVANTATTGTFTIPMMRAAGYRKEMAAGVEAAASSGGALVPPVMGAAAYMMLEIVSPPVTYLQVIQAALLPAILYYLSLFLIVHFYSKRLAAGVAAAGPATTRASDADGAGQGSGGAAPIGDKAARVPLSAPAGLVFVAAFASLLGFLFAGYSAFRAVTLALGVILVLSMLHPATRLGFGAMVRALTQASRDVIPLVCAAACVGIVIGVVTLTGVGSRFPALILPLADNNLFLALLMLMLSSIVLGMGLPSVVCYLLLATLVGPALGDLGVVPLAAHFFIFYFGMLSMVTPPVALAAYAASSIAGSPMMATAMAAFRCALVGFTLPFMFVFRPELLMLVPGGPEAPGGLPAPVGAVAYAFGIAALGILAFASGLSRYLWQPIGPRERWLFFLAAALLMFPGDTVLAGLALPMHDIGGAVLLAVLLLRNWRSAPRPTAG